MMHQDSLEPAAIRFTFKWLQEFARRSGYFLPAVFHVFISTGTLLIILKCFFWNLMDIVLCDIYSKTAKL